MADIYLEEISIYGFRSCKNTRFLPNSSLSALIGINGAGKTNVLNALRLLNPNRYGRSYTSKKDDATLPETTISAAFRVGDKTIRLRLTLSISSSRGGEEVVAASEQWNFFDITKSKKWIDLPLHLLRNDPSHSDLRRALFFSNRTSSPVSRYAAIDKQLSDILQNKELLRVIQSINKFRTQIKYYSATQFTDATRCPSSFEVNGDGELESNYPTSRNSSHVQFMFDLYSLKTKDPELYVEYETFISKKMLGLVSRLSWKLVPLSSNTVEIKSGGSVKRVRQYKTLVIPKVQIGSSRITFNQLSEGTFKTLALIFYLMTDRGSCLLIEEPEVCIHHGLLRRILSTIKAHSRSCQVVFSTHSDLVLDSVDISNVFVVDMKHSVTRVTELRSWAGAKGMAALGEYMNETGTLGDYWRSGGFIS